MSTYRGYPPNQARNNASNNHKPGYPPPSFTSKPYPMQKQAQYQGFNEMSQPPSMQQNVRQEHSRSSAQQRQHANYSGYQKPTYSMPIPQQPMNKQQNSTLNRQQRPAGYPSDTYDPPFAQQHFSRPNPSYPQPPYKSKNQPSAPVPYGQDVSSEENDFYLYTDPKVRDIGTPKFKLSNCKGRKRALLIGINYFNTSAQLNGCINDVRNIKEFLISLYDFKEQDMVILTDDQSANSKLYPTRTNILSAMQWLVTDSKPNDSFFFHFSGHGGRVKDVSGDEDDGYDETIYPVDHDKYQGESGQIIDDLMHDIMVRPLCEGCRLTCIFDSCHSGTALDLPYVYSTKGTIKEQNLFKNAGKGLISAGMSYASGNKSRALSSLVELGKGIVNSRDVQEQNRKNNSSPADVIMFSGCKDNQTSADAQEEGKATGAMSYAFTTTLRQNPNQSYHSLLNNVRAILRDKYSQRPQLSASHPIDVNLEFVC